MKYFWLTLKHKWFVLVAGISFGAPLWKLLIHDWSKFLPSEYPHYQKQFFGSADDGRGFIFCWLKHQNRHSHHWEYWIPRTGHNRCTPPYPDNIPIPMSEEAALEMAADWFGASRAYEGRWPQRRKWSWLQENFETINIHPETRTFLRELLSEYLPLKEEE